MNSRIQTITPSGFCQQRLLRSRLWVCGVAVVALSACATGPTASANDPLESMNRATSTFNYALDKGLIAPVARGYRTVTPEPIQSGVSNFFNNLREVWSIPNSLLQLKAKDAVESTMRVAVNTVFGFGGLIDLGTAVRMQRHNEDFGQTLGYWGVPAGPFVVLPILGPSTLRDVVATPLDLAASMNGPAATKLAAQPHEVALRNSLTGAEMIDQRATLLPITDLAEQVAVDLYTFSRDAYLQKRENDVTDGKSSAILDGQDDYDKIDVANEAKNAAANPPPTPAPAAPLETPAVIQK